MAVTMYLNLVNDMRSLVPSARYFPKVHIAGWGYGALPAFSFAAILDEVATLYLL